MPDLQVLVLLPFELVREVLDFLRTLGAVRLPLVVRFCGLTVLLVDFRASGLTVLLADLLTSGRRSVFPTLVEGRVDLVEGLTVLEGLVEERFVPGAFCLTDGRLLLSDCRRTSGLRICGEVLLV